MKMLLALVVLSIVSNAEAQAGQGFGPSAQIGSVGYTKALKNERSQAPRLDDLECLVRIKDGRRVCHTRDAWRVIAKRLEHKASRCARQSP